MIMIPLISSQTAIVPKAHRKKTNFPSYLSSILVFDSRHNFHLLHTSQMSTALVEINWGNNFSLKDPKGINESRI